MKDENQCKIMFSNSWTRIEPHSTQYISVEIPRDIKINRLQIEYIVSSELNESKFRKCKIKFLKEK